MLRKLALALLSALLVAGCSKNPSSNKTAPGNSRKADGKIEVKDRVVIPVDEYGTTYFEEGEVTAINGSRATVSLLKLEEYTGKFVSAYQTKEADLTDTYEVPDKDSPLDVKAGDTMLVRDEVPRDSIKWYPAEAVKSDNLGTQFKQGNGTLFYAGPGAILKPTGKMLALINKEKVSSQLLSEGSKRNPVSVEDYSPKVGDKVLGKQFNIKWASGTISSIAGGGLIQISWDDPADHFAEAVNKVIPLPVAAKTPTPTVGQYVIIKPTSGDNWLYAQVTKVDGQAVEVKTEGDSTRTVVPGEFWPLE
jgi:hypothetical protein